MNNNLIVYNLNYHKDIWNRIDLFQIRGSPKKFKFDWFKFKGKEII